MVSTASSIQPYAPDSNWPNYFRPRDAIRAVMDHCDTLPSYKTEERYTHRAYRTDLEQFLIWTGGCLVTEDVLSAYIAHLKRLGLKSSTIGRKMAPIRLYLRKLATQFVNVHGAERDFVMDCKERLLAAATQVKAPNSETSSNMAPVDQTGIRLERSQLNTLFRSIDRDTKKGRRDLALLYAGFTTGLRIAELRRITLNSITPKNDHYLVTVIGKRNNTDPVPLDHDAWVLIQNWVNAYNDGLDDDDPRRITGDIPLWQPLLHGDNHHKIGACKFDPARAISATAIRNIVKNHVQHALGIEITAHDMRRTIAALMRDEGAAYDAIRQLLRHRNIYTTARYVGPPKDWTVSLISRKRRFTGIQDNQYEEIAS